MYLPLLLQVLLVGGQEHQKTAWSFFFFFVSSANIEKAIAGEVLGKEAVETRPEKDPNCCNHESTSIYITSRNTL